MAAWTPDHQSPDTNLWLLFATCSFILAHFALVEARSCSGIQTLHSMKKTMRTPSPISASHRLALDQIIAHHKSVTITLLSRLFVVCSYVNGNTPTLRQKRLTPIRENAFSCAFFPWLSRGKKSSLEKTMTISLYTCLAKQLVDSKHWNISIGLQQQLSASTIQ